MELEILILKFAKNIENMEHEAQKSFEDYNF